MEPTARAFGRGRPLVVSGVLLAGLTVGIAVGVRVFWPFLVIEHRRLEPSAAVVLWSGDAVALLAFLLYVGRHAIGRGPVGLADVPASGLDRRFKVILAGMIAAFVLDLGDTLTLMEHEGRAFGSAQLVQATVTRVRSRSFPIGTVYALDCRFADRRGVAHEATFTLRDDNPGGFPFTIPPPTRTAIRGGRVPFPVGVAYNPGRPDQSWLLGSRWYDQDRLHLFSLVVMNAQLLGIIAFTIALRHQIDARRLLPWWHDLHMVVPLAIEVAAVLFVGLVELSGGRVTWWTRG